MKKNKNPEVFFPAILTIKGLLCREIIYSESVCIR